MSLASPIPKILAYLRRVEGRSVFSMNRDDWLKLAGNEGKPIEIDVAHTPVAGVAQSASVVGAFAVNSSSSPNEIHIFRYDPVDAPTPYNLDKYSVWEDLAAHKDYSNMLQSASIIGSKDLDLFLHNNVLIIKEEKGGDHWLPTVPASAIAVMKRA